MKKTVLTSLSNFIVMMLLTVMAFSGCKPGVVTPQEPIGKQHKGSGKLVDLYVIIGSHEGQLYKYNEYVKSVNSFFFKMDYEGNYYHRTIETPRYNFTKNDVPLEDFNNQPELYMDYYATHFTVYNELFGVAKHDGVLSFFAGGEWYKLETDEGQLDKFLCPVVDQDTIYGVTKIDANFYDVAAFPLVNNRPTKGVIHPIKIPAPFDTLNTKTRLNQLAVHNGNFAFNIGNESYYINNQKYQISNDSYIIDMDWTDSGDLYVLTFYRDRNNEFGFTLLKNNEVWEQIDNNVCTLNQNGQADLYIHGEDIYVLGTSSIDHNNFQMVIWHDNTVKTLNNFSNGAMANAELFPVISWE